MQFKNNSKINIIALFVIIGLASAGFTYYYYSVNADKKAKDILGATIDKNTEKKDTLNNLKKILLIDENTKDPAIATIVDPEKVKKSNPEFYKNVEKDDTLVVYPSKAIIFREDKNKIINIAPIVNSGNTEGIRAENITEIKNPTSSSNPKN
jgi:hypothetical protein